MYERELKNVNKDTEFKSDRIAFLRWGFLYSRTDVSTADTDTSKVSFSVTSAIKFVVRSLLIFSACLALILSLQIHLYFSNFDQIVL